ncbi:MAG: hypothetical protein WDZ35_11285 [Crocinitomicaceae bacterium]
MEASVIYVQKSRTVKNPKLKIVQYLIAKGALPESIRFSNQEVKFEYNMELQKDEEAWCEELTHAFEGKIQFLSKFPRHHKMYN